MKKITLIALSFALIWQVNAQTLENFPQRKNELKLDVAYLLGATLKAEYEYLINDWSSVGVSAFHNFNSGNPSFRTQVLGIYRLYFGKEPATGFFLEGNIGLVSGYWYRYAWWHYSYEQYTAGGVGIALGWKWYIPRSGIVLDIFLGGGRLLGDNDYTRSYPRMGIAVGKRF